MKVEWSDEGEGGVVIHLNGSQEHWAFAEMLGIVAFNPRAVHRQTLDFAGELSRQVADTMENKESKST